MNNLSNLSHNSNACEKQATHTISRSANAWINLGSGVHPMLEAIGDASARECRAYQKSNPLSKTPLKGVREFYDYLSECAPDKMREIDGKVCVDETFANNLMCRRSLMHGYVFERISK